MACNDIVLTGSFNGWKSNAAECVKVEPVEGFDGWYVGAFDPEDEPDPEKGIQAKPIMLDVDGNFYWDYQVGAATAIRGGVQVVQGVYAGEIDLNNYGNDYPNVFNKCSWMQLRRLSIRFRPTPSASRLLKKLSTRSLPV